VIAGSNALLARRRLGKAEARSAPRNASRPSPPSSRSSIRRTRAAREAVLMELARAYKLAGKTEDARKTRCGRSWNSMPIRSTHRSAH
jgi:hypothetical protein